MGKVFGVYTQAGSLETQLLDISFNRLGRNLVDAYFGHLHENWSSVRGLGRTSPATGLSRLSKKEKTFPMGSRTATSPASALTRSLRAVCNLV